MGRHAIAEFDGAPMSSLSEYGIWAGMISRCESENNTAYRHYGGRGISVHPNWRGSFLAFLTDVGRRPTEGHSIDRINVSGNYEPGNVRWATASEQASNRRPLRLVRLAPIANEAGATTALVALRAWIEARGVPVLRLAPEFGVAQPPFSRWLSGHARPEHHHRIRIHRLTGIPIDDWLTDDEYVVAYGEARAHLPSP